MRAISYTAARKNLATTMKKVCDDHKPIIVTRKILGFGSSEGELIHV